MTRLIRSWSLVGLTLAFVVLGSLATGSPAVMGECSLCEGPGAIVTEGAGFATTDLISRRVAPGVVRIRPQRTSHELGDVRFLDIALDGTIWAGTRSSVFRLDRPKEFGAADRLPGRVTGVTTGPDGQVLVEGWGPIAVFDGKGWMKFGPDRPRDMNMARPLITADGTVYALPTNGGVARLQPNGWTRDGWNDWLRPVADVVEAPDGSIWAGLDTFDWTPFEGRILRHDGESWTAAPPPLEGQDFRVTDLASSSDGTVWASILPATAASASEGDYSRARLARWDGHAWTSYAWPSWMRPRQRSPVRQMVAGHDGTVWFTRPLMSFDGETWRQFAIPARPRSPTPRTFDLAVAPDASVWIVVRDLIKFRTSRPDGIYVIDPNRAEPTDVEAAVIIETQSEDVAS